MSTVPNPATPSGGEFAATPLKLTSRTPAGALLSAEDLITLNEEIASMAKAGLPLDQGLALVARELCAGQLRNVTQKLADDLRAGLTLPDALKKQEKSIPEYYAALVTAGIRSGRLHDVLSTVTVYARTAADFRSNIVGALIYPAVVLLLGIALIVFVGYAVLPTFAKIYVDFRMKLPLVTEILIFVGTHSLELLVLPAVVLALGLGTERWWLRSSEGGRRLWTRIVYSLPVFGTVARAAQLAGFTELLGILVEQDVPLPEALRLAGETSSDPLLKEGTRRVESDLRQGMPFGVALRQQRMVPDLVVWMIGFGEKKGSLAEALKNVAQMYRRQAEIRAAFLRTILPPMLIIILAGSLGFLFIFGLLGPLFDLLNGLSGGLK